MESWKNNRYFELNGFTLGPLLSDFSFSRAYVVKNSCTWRMLQLCEKTQVATNISGTQTLFSLNTQRKVCRALVILEIRCSVIYMRKLDQVPPLSSSPSVPRLVIPFRIFPHLLCMLCLRISSLSCSQAGNPTWPVQSSHLKIVCPWTSESWCHGWC